MLERLSVDGSAPPWERQDDAVEDERSRIEVARSDPIAFSQVYERHLPGIYSYARARLQNEDDALDVSQQVFVQALAALPRYRADGPPFGVWLYRIARNAVIDFHRKRRHTVDIAALPEFIDDSTDTMDAKLVQAERIARLQLLLAEVPAGKRDLLALRFAAGLKLREIGEVLGRSEAAVKMDLRRTLAELKEQYDAY